MVWVILHQKHLLMEGADQSGAENKQEKQETALSTKKKHLQDFHPISNNMCIKSSSLHWS